MPRKTDKLRPYRVDYFEHQETVDGKVLLRAAIIRAAEAGAAKEQMTRSGRTVTRAYRFYRSVPGPKRVTIALPQTEFATKSAAQPEAMKCPTCGIGIDDNGDGDCAFCSSPVYMAAHAVNDLGNTPAAQADMDAVDLAHDAWLADQVVALGQFWERSTPAEREAKIGQEIQGIASLAWSDLSDILRETLAEESASNPTKHSDPFDAMMATMPQPSPASGPNSEATKAVVADLNSMWVQDLHEQMMDSDPGSRKWIGYPSAPTLPDVELGKPGSPAYESHIDPLESCPGCQPRKDSRWGVKPTTEPKKRSELSFYAGLAFIIGVLILLMSFLALK
jgi:hypothetical protein